MTSKRTQWTEAQKKFLRTKVVKIQKMISGDHIKMMIKIVTNLDISKQHAVHSVHEYLGIRNLCRARSQSIKNNTEFLILSCFGIWFIGSPELSGLLAITMSL